MTWEKKPGPSSRSAELPPNWLIIRKRVLSRDRGVCQIRGDRCTVRATEVDHIQRGQDHSDENLRAACRPCHTQRSGRDGGQESGRARRARAASRFRTPEPHPSERKPR